MAVTRAARRNAEQPTDTGVGRKPTDSGVGKTKAKKNEPDAGKNMKKMEEIHENGTPKQREKLEKQVAETANIHPPAPPPDRMDLESSPSADGQLDDGPKDRRIKPEPGTSSYEEPGQGQSPDESSSSAVDSVATSRNPSPSTAPTSIRESVEASSHGSPPSTALSSTGKSVQAKAHISPPSTAVARGSSPSTALDSTEDANRALQQRSESAHLDDIETVGPIEADDCKPQGFIKGPFGLKYGIMQHGPRNSRKFSMKCPTQANIQKDTPFLADASEGPILGIQGVAVYLPKGYKGHPFALLNPEAWGKREPLSRIWVRRGEDPNQPYKSWVKRATVRRDWPNGNVEITLSEDLKVGDYAVLRKGQRVKTADWKIASAAIKSETNYENWVRGDRAGDNNRSPSPDAEEGSLFVS